MFSLHRFCRYFRPFSCAVNYTRWISVPGTNSQVGSARRVNTRGGLKSVAQSKMVEKYAIILKIGKYTVKAKLTGLVLTTRVRIEHRRKVRRARLLELRRRNSSSSALPALCLCVQELLYCYWWLIVVTYDNSIARSPLSLINSRSIVGQKIIHGDKWR